MKNSLKTINADLTQPYTILSQSPPGSHFLLLSAAPFYKIGAVGQGLAQLLLATAAANRAGPKLFTVSRSNQTLFHDRKSRSRRVAELCRGILLDEQRHLFLDQISARSI